MWLFRPILADPPLYTIRDLNHLTLDEVMDAHEALNLRTELARRSARKEKPAWP